MPSQRADSPGAVSPMRSVFGRTCTGAGFLQVDPVMHVAGDLYSFG